MGAGSVQRLGVLADDLTGAHASAAQLVAGGHRASVVWEPDALPDGDVATVVDMRTRDRREHAADLAQGWARTLRDAGHTRIELRVDTTLRGATAAELSGVLRGLQWPDTLVVAVPAYPAAGRTTVAGTQRVSDASGELVIEDAPARLFGGERWCHVPIPLLRQGRDVVAAHVVAARRDGTNRVLVDAESDDHLRLCAEAVEALHAKVGAVVTVSSGAWLSHYPRPAPSFVVVVVASPTPANAAQLAFLSGLPDVAILRADSSGDGIETAFDARPSAVVVETLSQQSGGDHSVAATRTARLVAQAGARAGLRCAGFVVTGGAAAAHLVDVLGAHGLHAEREVAALCPQGRLADGHWSSLPLVTKGGVIGPPDTLLRLITAVATARQPGTHVPPSKECHV